MKTGQTSLSVVQVNYAFDKALKDPDALLDRYTTLTGWSEAVRAAGARRSAVVQRFHRSARFSRNGIDYFFVDRGVSAAAAQLAADVAHVNGLVFPLRTWRLRRALPSSTAIVVQNHSDGTEVGRAPLFRLKGRACRGAVDAFLFAAEEHAAAWRRAGLIAPDQPTHLVMEASTWLRPMPRAAAREQTAMRGSPAVLWVGRLNENKDPLTVLDAFERTAAPRPNATLTMVYSEGDLLSGVSDRIASSATLRDRVRLVGLVAHDRMAAFFSAADLFIVGSHHEGSGYSLLEAIACGAVPVVTNIPTFRAMTAEGSIGALWTPGDAADCAHALLKAASNDLVNERERTTAHFDRELSWQVVGRRAVTLYGKVVQEKRGAR